MPHLRLRQVALLVQQLNRPPQPFTLLDVGCSTGHLRTLLPPTCTYTGIDFIAPKDPPQFTFHQLDLNQAPIPPHITNVDCIVCCGAIEYIHRPKELLANLHSRLRPGGSIIASYFNFNHIYRLYLAATNQQPYFHPDWRCFYSPSKFREVLTSAGFNLTRHIPHLSGFGPSPSIDQTTDLPALLPKLRPWSYLTAHQFIFVAIKP